MATPDINREGMWNPPSGTSAPGRGNNHLSINMLYHSPFGDLSQHHQTVLEGALCVDLKSHDFTRCCQSSRDHFLSRACHIELSPSDTDRWHWCPRDFPRWVEVLLLVFVIPRLCDPNSLRSGPQPLPSPWGKVRREVPQPQAAFVSVKDTLSWVTSFYSLSETKLDHFEGIHYDPSVHSHKSLTFLFLP